jgi:hypothetical protein
MREYDIQKKTTIFFRDYWSPDSPEVEKEGGIHQRLKGAQVPCIPPFGVGNDVRNFATRVQELRRLVGPVLP